MSIATEEIIRVCEALPPDKRMEVADFARFLLARQQDAVWDRVLDEKKKLPRLDGFLRESASEPDGPLDIDRM